MRLPKGYHQAFAGNNSEENGRTETRRRKSCRTRTKTDFIATKTTFQFGWRIRVEMRRGDRSFSFFLCSWRQACWQPCFIHRRPLMIPFPSTSTLSILFLHVKGQVLTHGIERVPRPASHLVPCLFFFPDSPNKISTKTRRYCAPHTPHQNAGCSPLICFN